MTDIPRPEHPRPDFRRHDWLNLNGRWDFAFDREDVGVKEKWYLKHDWPKKILVPFAHQSKLSGIGDTKHYRQVWYHRTFVVPEKMQGKQIRLHVGAADFEATVWVNGKKCGTYESGQTPFTIDITPFLKPEADAENDLVIRVYDNELDPEQPRGKQKANGKRNRFNYTHITGIWQTVWLEAVNPQYLDRYEAVTTINPSKADITVFAKTAPADAMVRATLIRPRGSRVTANAEGRIVDGKATMTLNAPNALPWSFENPNLYSLRLELLVDGKVVDRVDSYIGFRTFEVKNKKFYLNGRPVWLSGALDQGYWPQGLLTAPSDQAMVDDIRWVKRLGLNHMRKHQVVGDPQFLYHCDRLGLLVWGEMANAGRAGLTNRG
ncbi:MAG: glycoside hydrolase family 2 TIM barrel-domain containing protein, partial [Planctomycetia bacterium]